MKKCQVSLIIIVGIAFLAIALFSVFYFTHLKEKNTNMLVLDKETSANMEPIINYMELCVENIAKEGIGFISNQGGVIYSSQGGLTVDFQNPIMYVEKNKGGISYRLPYLIEYPLNIGDCSTSMPNYPLRYNRYYPYGKQGNSFLESDRVFAQQYCFGLQKDISNSRINLELAAFIESKIASCDLTQLSDFNIATGKPKIQVRGSADETLVILNYPLDVVKKSTGAHTKLSEFRKNLKFNFEKIKRYVQKLNELDTNDPLFNIALGLSDSDFSVNIEPVDGGYDDVISIAIPNGISEADEFSYARRNRPPALVFVYDVAESAVQFTEGFVVNYSDVIKQDLYAVDPDEDNVNLSVKIGEGVYARMFKPSEPYTVTAGDINNGYIIIRIEATDGQYTDYQEIEIENDQ